MTIVFILLGVILFLFIVLLVVVIIRLKTKQAESELEYASENFDIDELYSGEIKPAESGADVGKIQTRMDPLSVSAQVPTQVTPSTINQAAAPVVNIKVGDLSDTSFEVEKMNEQSKELEEMKKQMAAMQQQMATMKAEHEKENTNVSSTDIPVVQIPAAPVQSQPDVQVAPQVSNYVEQPTEKSIEVVGSAQLQENGEEIEIIDTSVIEDTDGEEAAVVIDDISPKKISVAPKIQRVSAPPIGNPNVANQAFNSNINGVTTINQNIQVEPPKKNTVSYETEIIDLSEIREGLNQ